MNIILNENGMRISFRVNDDRTVDLADFSAACGSTSMPYMEPLKNGKKRTCQFLQIQVTGESTLDSCYKKNAGSEGDSLLYAAHSIEENASGKLLTIELENGRGLYACYHMQFYTGIPMVRSWTDLRNVSEDNIGIEFITSFLFTGISKNGTLPYYEKTDIYTPYNGWAAESDWVVSDCRKLGLVPMAHEGYNLDEKGSDRYCYGSRNSWSTGEFLPVCMVRDRETNEIWYGQVEHSGSWQIEYGSANGHHLYAALLGPNDESQWWKNLAPGQVFTTVPASFGVCLGNESDAVAALTLYRRAIRRGNSDNKKCSVVFNDYMNCLIGDPTEEKELKIIDLAAKLGCEYYCLDCGWYDDGPWWNKVGEWKESEKRFPNGLKKIFEYARSKGLKMGMWLEIEVMGTQCPIADALPDDWFVIIHGKRRISNRRYLLDFRNPEVYRYCMDVVDRLIAEYGCEFFKIDYNVTHAFGSELNGDSAGDNMLEHYRAYYRWIGEVYAKYPDLIIENCGSGGQRMDYGLLSLHSLQSTSDQTDYINNSYIGVNVASAVTPEQAGMWVYPYENDAEHIIFNMVNGMLLRPYISGLVWNISEENLALLKEGIDCYKKIRSDIPEMVPFFPFGFTYMEDKVLAYGLRNSKKAYLSVLLTDETEGSVPFEHAGLKVKSATRLYPTAQPREYRVDNNTLYVKMPQKNCAGFFELELD